MRLPHRDPLRPLTPPERAVRAAYLLGLRGPVEAADPAPWAARELRDAPPPPLALVSVYRRRNVATLARLLASLPPGTPARLWALDEPDPALAAHTEGSGPGARLVLLNRLIAAVPAGERWLVVADDDVRLVRGSVAGLAALARAAGLDVSQPSHDRLSKVNHPVTRARPLHVARRTRFVEAGPLLLLSPRARRALTPLPEELGMGWGVEALWGAGGNALALGIVDAVRMRHLERTAAGYDAGGQRAQEQRVLAQVGVAGWPELQRTVGHWWAWQRPPAWR